MRRREVVMIHNTTERRGEMNAPKIETLQIKFPTRDEIEMVLTRSAMQEAKDAAEGHVADRDVRVLTDLCRDALVPILLGILDCLKASVQIEGAMSNAIAVASQPQTVPPGFDPSRLRG